MAKHAIVWTVLPNGWGRGAEDGALRLSVVVSPRLTPQAADEQVLKAFDAFVDWPARLEREKFAVEIDGQVVEAKVASVVDASLWPQVFPPETPVDGWQFTDMSQMNLRSFPARTIAQTLRKHYGAMAAQAGGEHPKLLPRDQTDPLLQGLLGDLGHDAGAVRKGVGFSRFFTPAFDRVIDSLVFNPQSHYEATAPAVGEDGHGVPMRVRALPPRWRDARNDPPNDPNLDTQVMAAFKSDTEYALYQADRFYRRTALPPAQQAVRRPDGQNVPAAPDKPRLDFHGIAASLGDHPALMRALGLVIDLLIDAAPVRAKLANQASTTGWIALHTASNAADDRFPRTAWQATPRQFLLAPRARQVVADGLLRLEGASDQASHNRFFDVLPFDVDGAALKTANTLLTAQQLLFASGNDLASAGRVTYTTGETLPLAALRSGSVGVTWLGRAGELAVAAGGMAAKNQALGASAQQGREVLLFAEDVLRGFRVDAEDGGGRWRSLCQRQPSYALPEGTPLLPHGRKVEPDEGYVKAASTSSPPKDDAATDTDHYLHESLFRWAGWSLAVPRPGRAIRAGTDPATGLQTETPTDLAEDDAAPEGSRVRARFAPVPGTLPRLRFGTAYRFRARTVDLAGNSLPLDEELEDTLAHASEPVLYGRLEPIDPPALVQAHRVSEGESLERLVIRSAREGSAEAYVAEAASPLGQVLSQREATQAPGTVPDFSYGATCERHAVPPKAAQTLAEQHGAFDAAFGAGDAALLRDAYAVSAREAGTLYDGPAGQVEIVTPRAVAGTATSTSLPVQPPRPEAPAGDRLTGGQYIVHGEALIDTPYLSDPAAGGLSLRHLERLGVRDEHDYGGGVRIVRTDHKELVLVVPFDDEPTQAPFEAAFPGLHRRGLRIHLAERKVAYDDEQALEDGSVESALPDWNPATRTVTLFVAKGRIVHLAYACHAAADLAKHFALPFWTGSSAGRAQAFEEMLQGVHHMITPFRPVTVVHATQQPVFRPRFSGLFVNRNEGSHEARLFDRQVVLHAPSTGQLEIVASWDEWVDNPDEPAPRRVAGHAQLPRIELPNDLAAAPLLAQPDAAARLRPLQAWVEALRGDKLDGKSRGDMHDFGDTKFRFVRYHLRATSRFREYTPPELWTDATQVSLDGPQAQGERALVAAPDDFGAPLAFLPAAFDAGEAPLRLGTPVPASARPAAPALIATVPTFRWHASERADGTVERLREGNGLRVYLERPWFSSGEGELLGVVLAGDGAAFGSIDITLAPFVTQWGRDPLFDARVPKMAIAAADFPARVADEACFLPEAPLVNGSPRRLHVVGHRVQWDGAGKRWFCDIELEPGRAYLPFVRLALVRYQPHALQAAKVSPVALAEFAQVLPRRRCLLKATGDSVQLSLYGTVPEAGSMAATSLRQGLDFGQNPGGGADGSEAANRVELVLQARDAQIDSDLAWTDVRVLASSAADPSPIVPPVLTPVPGPGIRPERTPLDPIPARRVQPRGGLDLSLEPRRPIPPIFFEQPVWQHTVTLPAADGRVRRLMVREFERYFSDDIVQVRGLSERFPRRWVEERLVYAQSFELG